MKDGLISVIVPVYKVEDYLDRCVQSIVNQTYKNLEIILVDDGSPDNCPKMCDEWAEKDSRIKVVHKINEGVSVARNTGIEVATGEYIGFVDSDDYLDEQMYEKLITSCQTTNSDMAICRYKYVYEDGSCKDVVETNLSIANPDNIFKFFLNSHVEEKDGVFYHDSIMGAVWRLLIKKEVIGSTRFMKFKIAEDLIFVMNLIDKQSSFSVVDEPLYCYLQREGSAIKTYSRDNIIHRYNAFKHILNIMQTRLDKQTLDAFKFYNYASLVNVMLKSDSKTILKEMLNDKFFTDLNSKQNYQQAKQNLTSFKTKLSYFLAHKKLFWLYKILLKMKG
jgi:glycosyltransferase involved in cell wall biosynthesis